MDVFLNNYEKFVWALVSAPSKNNDDFISRIRELEESGVLVSNIVTAAIGLSSESGELAEIIKKVVFHSKPFTDEIRTHIKKECGDIMWYMALMCKSLNISLEEVINTNIEKLSSRYPGGAFDPYYSENRKVGDI